MLNIILIILLINSILLARNKPWQQGYMACGLFGFSGKKKADPEKLALLAAYNEDRGNHSWGIFTNTDGKILKDTGGVMDTFLPKHAVPTGTVVIGHTRFGTVGAKTQRNAR